MDDYPAGLAMPGPRRPRLSVVIPVHNGGRAFERCLRGLRASTWTEYELIVVDDGSADGSAALAQAYGARVLRNSRARGPASARNVGVEAASTPLIFFLDSDVIPHPDTLARAFARFEAQPTLSALFGSYDDNPPDQGPVSRYRNLLHHYVHQQGEFLDDARPAHTFWTGCGVIRKDDFLALGGFDPDLYRRPAIEDIELGYRLTRAGYRILLARDVQVAHLKRWTLPVVLKTDLFQRGIPWMLLLLRSGMPEKDLNVSPAQRLSVAATGLALLGLAEAPINPPALAASAACVALTIALNHRFYRFLASRGGARFALLSIPLHQMYFFCCGLSVVMAWIYFHIPMTLLGERHARLVRQRPDSARARVPAPWHLRLKRRLLRRRP
ncbi:MAG: glycosyltransferase family A protein [Isosphaeraceae bacterium]